MERLLPCMILLASFMSLLACAEGAGEIEAITEGWAKMVRLEVVLSQQLELRENGFGEPGSEESFGPDVDSIPAGLSVYVSANVLNPSKEKVRIPSDWWKNLSFALTSGGEITVLKSVFSLEDMDLRGLRRSEKRGSEASFLTLEPGKKTLSEDLLVSLPEKVEVGKMTMACMWEGERVATKEFKVVARTPEHENLFVAKKGLLAGKAGDFKTALSCLERCIENGLETYHGCPLEYYVFRCQVGAGAYDEALALIKKYRKKDEKSDIPVPWLFDEFKALVLHYQKAAKKGQ